MVSIKENIQMIEIHNSEDSEDIDYEAEMNEEGSENDNKKESSKMMESEERRDWDFDKYVHKRRNQIIVKC